MAINFGESKEYIAEAIGTMVFVATAVIIASTWGAGMTAAFGFAITFVALIYIAGKVCNCHFNPIITLGMLINGRMEVKNALFYMLAQIIGAIIGCLFALFMMTQEFGNANVVLYGGSFGGDYIRTFEVCGAFILEFLFAAVLVSVVLRATKTSKIDVKSGAIIAFAMFALIWFGSAMTRTTLNPAISIGDAIAMMFSDIGDPKFQPIKQLWLFIIAPALGAVVGSLLYVVLEGGEVDVARYAAAIKSIKPAKKEEPVEEPVEEVSEEGEFTEEVIEEPLEEESTGEFTEEVLEEPLERPAEDAVPEVESEETETVVETESVPEERKD